MSGHGWNGSRPRLAFSGPSSMALERPACASDRRQMVPVSAPDAQNQKIGRIRRAPTPSHRTAPIGAVCLLSLRLERDVPEEYSPPNQNFVNFWYARYTRAWRLSSFFAFLNCGSGLPLWLFKFSPLQPQKGNPTPKCALWITHFFSENGGERYR